MPALDSHPLRLQALNQQEVVLAAGPQHLAVFPLTTDREVVGVLEIESAQALDSQAHRLVGSILRIYRNFQALLDYSERDTLTGLLNRKTFDEAFYKLSVGGQWAHADAAETEIDSAQVGAEPGATEAERRTPPLAQPHYIGVIDIDHFKLVNDTTAI